MRTYKRYLLHAGLFIVTLVSTSLTGAILFIGRSLAWEAGETLFYLGDIAFTTTFFADAFTFGGGLITFLTVHEFGHYIAARLHGINSSLPYFIPAPMVGIGTLGAVINIRQPLPHLTSLFDLGVSGPIAGFVIVLVILIWAMASLPPPEYMFGVAGHEALIEHIQATGRFPDPSNSNIQAEGRLNLGVTPLYWMLSKLFPNVPPLYEMYHYPLLFAAWLGLLFTALNLMPIGQLDGGHITYALFGPVWHVRISRVFIFVMLSSMATGCAVTLPYLLTIIIEQELIRAIVTWVVLVAVLTLCTRKTFRNHWWRVMLVILGIASFATVFPGTLDWFGYFGWLPWCLILVFLLKIDHPPVPVFRPIQGRRRLIGYLTLAIFVLCFSIKPIYSV